MRNSLAFKLLLVLTAVAVAACCARFAFDDDGDLSGAPDFQAALIGEDVPLTSPPALAGYDFSREFRPSFGEGFARFLEMHEKSPPAHLALA